MKAGARKAAMDAGSIYYESDKACPRGHVGKRQTSSGSCVECRDLLRPDMLKRYYKKNKARHRLKCKEWQENNREKFLSAMRQWHAANRERQSQIRSAYYQANREKYKVDGQRWRALNPEKWNASCAQQLALRRASYRTPKWADRKAMREVYAEAKRIQKDTGVKQHVDHILPLRGEFICGLHVHQNLRVIAASLNRSKRNNFMPYNAPGLAA